MRKHCNRKPIKQFINPMMYVLEGAEPVSAHKEQVNTIKLRDRLAMEALNAGSATTADMDTLIHMSNITESVAGGIARSAIPIALAGRDALLAACRRGYDSRRFIVRAEEWRALNDLLDLHDELMDNISLYELERAVADVAQRKRRGSLLKLEAA
jgi:hypothetical protein